MRHISVIENTYDSYEFVLRLSLKIIRKIGWWQEKEDNNSTVVEKIIFSVRVGLESNFHSLQTMQPVASYSTLLSLFYIMFVASTL